MNVLIETAFKFSMACVYMVPTFIVSSVICHIIDTKKAKREDRIRRAMEVDAYHKAVAKEVRRKAVLETMNELYSERTNKINELEAELDMYKGMVERALQKEKAAAKKATA